MDSFTQCGLSHVLDSTNYAIVESMRTPAVTSHRPDVCSLTFTCNGNDQYEEVCITLSTSMTSAPRRSIKNTEFASIVAYTMHTSAFQILGLNERFYSNGEVREKNLLSANTYLWITEHCQTITATVA